jgi:uncharacterized membrane protein
VNLFELSVDIHGLNSCNGIRTVDYASVATASERLDTCPLFARGTGTSIPGAVVPDHNAFRTGATSAAMVLPSGFALPPLPYLLALLAGVAVAGAVLYRTRPRVTPRVVLSFTPWMVVGASLYALFQVEAVPTAVRPLLGAPAVYLATFTVAGLVWAAASPFGAEEWDLPSTPGLLLLIGTLTAGGVVGSALRIGLDRGGLLLGPPLAALVVSLLVATAVWLLAVTNSEDAAAASSVGWLVVLGHTLDGISTAVGSTLGFGEQTPLSRVLIQLGGDLVSLPFLGPAWLFVLVKVALATALIVFIGEYAAEEPERGYLLLGGVAAVGLGPGAHNLVLFAIV